MMQVDQVHSAVYSLLSGFPITSVPYQHFQSFFVLDGLIRPVSENRGVFTNQLNISDIVE